MNKQKLYIMIISIIGMLSTLMPWVNANVFGSKIYTAAGVEGNGKFSLIIFGAVCALCVIGNKSEKIITQYLYSIWVLSAINIIIFIVWMNEIVNYRYSLSAGHGVYVMLFSTVLIILLSIDNLKFIEKIENIFKHKK